MTDSEPARSKFWLRRLHSLSGVMPLGVFFASHLWTNAAALWGQRRFDDAVDRINSLPGLILLEVFGIFLPLSFHAGYGLWLTRRSAPNVATYPFARNWGYVLQRVSGVALLAFLLLHLWEFRVQKWLYGMDTHSFYPVLAGSLSSTRWGIPWRALVYLAGILATSVHFANGLFGFGCTWGLVASRPAQARLFAVTTVLGACSFVVGAGIVLHFATGPFWPAPAAEPETGASCIQLPAGEAAPKPVRPAKPQR